MQVQRLTLAGFRSYAALEVSFPPGPQVVVGPNAAGKTNLVEALVVLGLGHSHRTSTDVELIGWNADFARIEGELTTDGGGADRVEVVLARSGPSGGRKRIRVNGVARRAAALPAALRIVVFAPEDMLLVTGSPSLRRAVLDTLIVQRHVMGASTLSTYTRALQQRNNLLRAIRDGFASREELAFWDETLVREGGRIVEWRRALLAELAAPLAAAHAEIAPQEAPLTLGYVTNAPAVGSEDAGAALRRRLETAEKELWNGTTLIGPHRDDLVFELDGRDLAGFASRGQQRTAILALKLAQLELLTSHDGRPPLLLLDDVFSELDPDRRAHLVRRIGALPQAFVTTTTLDDLDPGLVARATSWRVSSGSLEPVGSPAVTGRKRPMRRLADLLPEVATQLGLEEELRLSRAMASWERLVAEHVPAAAGARLLAVQPPALLVSAGSPIVAQELRLRSRALLAAFASAPGGSRLVELRVVVRSKP